MSGKNNQNPCSEKPCLSKEYERPRDPPDANAEVRGRPVLYTGVVWIGILRRFLIPRTCGSALPPAEEPPKLTPCAKKVSHPHIADPSTSYGRAAQLTSPTPTLLASKNTNSKDGQELSKRQQNENTDHSPLASMVAQVREATVHMQELSRDLHSLLEEGRVTTSETISTLRSEDAVQFRWTVITLCGLAGYMSGLRRGSLVRAVYCMTGATAMATVCYPREARRYNSQGLALLRQGIVSGIALIKHGPEREPAVGKDIYKNSIRTDSKNKNSNENRITMPPYIQQQPYSSIPPSNHHTKDFVSEGLKYEQRNSQANHVNDPCPETFQQRNVSPPHFIQKSSTVTGNTGGYPSNPSASHGRLSQECEKTSVPDNANASPFVSPQKYGNNQGSYSFIQTPKIETPEHTTISDGTTANLHTYITHDSTASPGVQIEVNHESQFKDNSEGPTPNMGFQLIPVPEPTLVIEEEHISKPVPLELENGERNIHPLNKKLSRYYVKKPDESVVSVDNQYEDLYSKRNN